LYGGFELFDAAEGEALELPLGEFGKEALHEIQPRGGSGHEVAVDSGMPLEPRSNSLVLVGGVVVQDEVEVQLRVRAVVHLAEELQSLRHVGVSRGYASICPWGTRGLVCNAARVIREAPMGLQNRLQDLSHGFPLHSEDAVLLGPEHLTCTGKLL